MSGEEERYRSLCDVWRLERHEMYSFLAEILNKPVETQQALAIVIRKQMNVLDDVETQLRAAYRQSYASYPCSTGQRYEWEKILAELDRNAMAPKNPAASAAELEIKNSLQEFKVDLQKLQIEQEEIKKMLLELKEKKETVTEENNAETVHDAVEFDDPRLARAATFLQDLAKNQKKMKAAEKKMEGLAQKGKLATEALCEELKSLMPSLTKSESDDVQPKEAEPDESSETS